MRRLALLVAALLSALVAAAAAQAEVVTRQDNAGRTITFDVLTPGVDVDWYANLLRNAAHGDEISRVTIRVVAESEIPRVCAADAAACYARTGSTGTIYIPVGTDRSTAAIFLHEYGHHLDAAWSVAGVRELNGTPGWWEARGMAALLAGGRVAFDYSLGWSHSVGEIFAEDYAFVHTGERYAIPWLLPPDDSLKTALLAELGGATPVALPPAAPEAAKPPLTIVRQGTLRAGAARTIPFGLLGPGRRVTATAAVTGAQGAGPRVTTTSARLDVTCGGTLVKSIRVGRRTATIDVPGLGPASCEASLVNTGTSRQTYVLRLRLAVEPVA